jgi:hypothetical protein
MRMKPQCLIWVSGSPARCSTRHTRPYIALCQPARVNVPMPGCPAATSSAQAARQAQQPAGAALHGPLFQSACCLTRPRCHGPPERAASNSACCLARSPRSPAC